MLISLLLYITSCISSSSAALLGREPHGIVLPRGAQPNYPFDSATTPNCAWWIDNNGDYLCAEVSNIWRIRLERFLEWNPSITPDCDNFTIGRSYCVDVTTISTTTSVTTPKPASTTIRATTTTVGNGIATPSPIQAGMVKNCDLFHQVKNGDRCSTISLTRKVTLPDFYRWNPSVKLDCSVLLTGYYICYSIVGQTPSLPATTTKKPVTTGNGIKTPLPTQTGMVKNCDTFDEVKTGETCASIAKARGVTLANFVKWNPAVGGVGCAALWLGTFACVGVI